MSQLYVYLTSTIITIIIQMGGFLVAFALQTEVFYDVLGGVNYFAIAIYSAYVEAFDFRKKIFTVLFLLSRGWLLAFLAWRAHERGGDSRFDQMKDKFFQFMTAWIVQGMWVMLISLPMLFINSSNAVDVPLSTLDMIMAIGFLLAVIIEAAADMQKAAWVKSGRQGHFCQDGLWKYSRHPNYFGEMLMWWCAWLFAYNSIQSDSFLSKFLWFASVLSPIFTMHILLNIRETGIANAEGKGLKRYYENCPEEYAAYRANTSILIPMVGYAMVPKSLKRTIFCDFGRYEWRPRNKKKE